MNTLVGGIFEGSKLSHDMINECGFHTAGLFNAGVRRVSFSFEKVSLHLNKWMYGYLRMCNA